MQKSITTILFILISCSAFSQNTFYWGDGKYIQPDSLKNYKSINAMLISTGHEETGVDVIGLINPKTKKKYLASVWYVPFIHKPVLINGDYKGDYSAIIKKFNQDNYNTSGSGFPSDFDQLEKRPEVDTSFISRMIGRPDTIENNAEYHNGETWHYHKQAFQLIFADGKLTAYKAYEFKAARQQGFGIGDFHINVSESGDYVTGFRVNYYNFSSKRIKYVYTTITALNSVGDLVQTKTAKSIGPIEQNDGGFYNFDSLFFSRIIDKIRISGVKIQYFDGTFKMFNREQVGKIFIN